MAETVGAGEGAPDPGPVRSGSGRLPTLREAIIAFGHLTVLSTFALAQPLFSLLSDNPEFFAARGSSSGDVIVFALLLVLIPPLVLLGIEVLLGLAWPAARRGAHLVLMALLAAVIFVQALKDALGSSDVLLILVALALGAVAAALYARAEPVRSFMSVLTPAPLVFLVLFLFISPVSKITLADEASAKSVGNVARVPVVMIVFDEFPSTSLMDARRNIDAERYPGFAQLASDGTWFRNAHTIYDSTTRAVPAIMDGNYPEMDTLPTSSEHPNSIFALLGKTHRMNVSEEATTVCPRDLCTDARTEESFVDRLGSMTDDLSLVYAHVVTPPAIERDLPSVSENWGNFGADAGGGEVSDSATSVTPSVEEAQTRANLNGNRRQRFEEWTDAIGPGRRPALNFKHALLPHVPWQYLPDGQLYRRQADDPVSNLSRQSYPDEGQVEQLHMRHLLQLGFADLEIQRLISHLKDTGTYDESLIVVTADHGVSFKQGQFDRRKANEENIDEISPVPLFVKEPGQERGRIDDSIVETTDILPTIADVLGIELPDETDGRSAFSAEVRGRDEVKMLKRDLSGWIRVDGDEFDRLKAEELAEKVRLFGTGADGPDRIFRIGPNQDLLGTSVAGLGTAGRSKARVSLVGAGDLDDVDPEGGYVPIWIVGKVSGGAGDKRDIAVSVNGTIRAVGNSFKLATGGDELISVMLPPSALEAGRNEVEVYEVTGGSQLRGMGGN
jgi:hypothetical protein